MLISLIRGELIKKMERELPVYVDNVITNVYTLFEGGTFMDSEIKKIGNSKGIVIPASVIKMLNLKEKDKVEIKVVDNQIILTKVDTFNPKSLEELFIGYEGTYNEKIIFDDEKGDEVW